ncbi:hypothetical protein [Aureivirga sp. CE67]|uniref:hypothetical protein n=1 Tax=Aureivirga sp. CE67 TaxID=1788983 RepID=UPI0018C92B60|nr:hypothetical protein [Aureivirga sp. CE67]
MKDKENVFKDRTVRWFIGLPLFFSIISVILIYEETMYLSLTKDGFKNFMEWFQFPLYTAALAFPLGAFAVSNFRAKQMHKSIETAQKNIELAQSQNTFNNYYRHLEEFKKRLEKLEEKFGISFFDKTELYHSLFPDNSPRYLNINGISDDVNKIIETFYQVKKAIEEYHKELEGGILKKDEIITLLREVLPKMAKVENKLRIRYTEQHVIEQKIYDNNDNICSVRFFFEHTNLLNMLIVNEILKSLCSFCFYKEYKELRTAENKLFIDKFNKEYVNDYRLQLSRKKD